MLPEIKENFQEKLRLVVIDLVKSLDDDIKVMLADHSARGRLRSGDTIKRTMGFIGQGNADLYQAAIVHLQTLDIAYYASLEADMLALVSTAQKQYKSECLTRLQKSTELAGKPSLYERMLPELEAGMASDLAKFQNSINSVIVQIKLNKQISPLVKFLWGVEALLLLISMFIAGMWFKDPGGNYEPVLAGLGLAIPLILVVIKIGSKKAT